MNKKPANIILLLLTSTIWILILSRIIGFVKGDPDSENIPIIKQSKSASIEKKDTFSLILNYRDPFLSNQTNLPTKNQDVLSVAPKPTSRRLPQQKQTTVKWPDISYKGLVECSSEGRVVGIYTINGRKYISALGVTNMGVVVNTITSDSITVSYMDETKTFSKSVYK